MATNIRNIEKCSYQKTYGDAFMLKKKCVVRDEIEKALGVQKGTHDILVFAQCKLTTAPA